jgi:hypothetical protein
MIYVFFLKCNVIDMLVSDFIGTIELLISHDICIIQDCVLFLYAD